MSLKRTFSFLIFSATSFLLTACNDETSSSEGKAGTTPEQPGSQTETHGTEFKSGDITLASTLDKQQAEAGQKTYELKCQSCHKLTEDRIVGPGWAGVTKRREPHWIMNMINNVDMMLETDPEAQKLLEQCLVRMPNQNLTKDEAREVLEFMRQNDGIK